MASTKIIHVLKNDGFEEIFDLFKNTEAEEVILIFPKGSRFSKQAQYLQAIKREADSSGKRVSVMTADLIVAKLALQNGIELLRNPDPQKKQTPNVTDDYYEQANDSKNTVEDSEGNIETEIQPEVQLAAVKTVSQFKIIKDIVGPETDRQVKIKQEKSWPFEIEIRKEIPEKTDITGDITQVWASREQESHQLFKSPKGLRKVRSLGIFKKAPLFFVGGAIIVLFLILYTTLGNAQVIIRPQKQALNFPIKTAASSTITAINLEFNRIPGQLFGYKNEELGSFPVTGQKDVVQKASGKLTIYNKGVVSQRLVATTRFKSADGLIFRIPETISVPAAVKTGDTITAGKIESPVYADKAGVEYNISPTTFTIPGFESTPKLNDFYAKSDQPMTGGIIGPAKVVTEEDFTKANEALTAKLKEKILQSLGEQAGELKILDSISIKFEPPITNAKVGDAVDNLQMKVKGAASTVAFRESDILELVNNYVSQKGDLELLQKNLTIRYLNPQNSTDNSSMTFDIQVTGQAAVKIDAAKILKEIAGMKEDVMRAYFKGVKEIESARIILSPFWVKSIPSDSSKIKLIIEKE